MLLTTAPAFALQSRHDKQRIGKDQYCKFLKARKQEYLAQKKQSGCPEAVRFICQKKIGTNGLVITKPGEYRLIEDICFAPTEAGAKAITIAAPNVTLDLNGRQIVQINDTQNTIGIFTEPQINFLQVSNGAIIGFSALGIWVSQGAGDVLLRNLSFTGVGSTGHAPYATQDPLQNNSLGFFAGGIGLGGVGSIDNPATRISQVGIFDCTFVNIHNNSGPVLDPVSGKEVDVITVAIGGTSISKLNLENNFACSISSEKSTARGFSFSDVGSAFLLDNEAAKITHFKGGTGLFLSNATGIASSIVVEEVGDTGGIDLAQRGSIGIAALSCKELIIEDSFVTQITNSSSTGVAHGIDIRQSTNSLVTGSKVSDCSALNTGVSVGGMVYTHAETPDQGATFVECESLGNVNESGTAYGFLVGPLHIQTVPGGPILQEGTPQDVLIKDCIATKNTTAGILLKDASNCSVVNCAIRSNGHFGIALAETSGTLHEACSIENNTIEFNGTGLFDAGIQDTYTIDNMYINNTAFNNKVDNYSGIPTFTPLIKWLIPTGKPTGDLNQKYANLDSRSPQLLKKPVQKSSSDTTQPEKQKKRIPFIKVSSSKPSSSKPSSKS